MKDDQVKLIFDVTILKNISVYYLIQHHKQSHVNS